MTDADTTVPTAPPALRVSSQDYLWFVRRAVVGMQQIVTDLGDDLACTAPALAGANSPYGLLTHCLGVMAYWGGDLVAGRQVVRDRAAEFTATGTVADLVARADAALEQLAADLALLEPEAPLRREPDAWAVGPDRRLTQDAALVHLYEEMAQHHGQMQLMRDTLLVNTAYPDDQTAAAPAGFDHLPLAWLRAKQGVKWHRPGPDLLPAWVADMDYPVAPPVREAIEAALDRGDLGYPDWPVHPLAQPFAQRMAARYSWEPDPDHIRGVTDLISALQIVLHLATRPGDGVVAHTPNYPPFPATVTGMGRRLVAAPMVPEGAGWTWDHTRLEREAAAARVLLLVNPHNPTGRVFTREELQRFADLAEEHDLLVVADEIHADLAHAPHRHVPFASLSPDAAERTVTVTSATKAFNIAGLRTAVAHVGPTSLRAAWDAEPPDLHGALNVLGVEATRAAWTHGDAWLSALNAHLLAQRDHLTSRLHGTGVDLRPPEAGYLAWLDLARLALPEQPGSFLRAHAGLELAEGSEYGPGNTHRLRLNFATSRTLLDEAIDRMLAALAVLG